MSISCYIPFYCQFSSSTVEIISLISQFHLNDSLLLLFLQLASLRYTSRHGYFNSIFSFSVFNFHVLSVSQQVSIVIFTSSEVMQHFISLLLVTLVLRPPKIFMSLYYMLNLLVFSANRIPFYKFYNPIITYHGMSYCVVPH